LKLLYTNDAAGVHANSWYRATTAPDKYPQLENHTDTDVCVIGAGYTGLSTALHLAQAGYSVTILDAHRVGWGASGRNGGQLGTGFNQTQPELERLYGLSRARELWSLAEDAKRTIHDLCDRHAIDAHYKPGVIYAQHRRRALSATYEHVEHLRRHYNYEHIQPLDKHALRQLVNSADYHGGFIDHGAGHLHPLALAIGMGRAAANAGAQIYESSEVIRIHHSRNTQQGALHVITPQASVRAERVVLACNGYLDALQPRFAQRVMPINNFIVATEPLGERAKTLLAEDVAVADSRFVVNYYRRSQDSRLLFGGGESYGYRFPATMTRNVRRAMLRVFPQLDDVQIDYAWGGTLAITRSRMPCVRQLSSRVIAAGGYSGHGVALAVITGRVIAEKIAGDAVRFDWLANLPAARFPGSRWSRSTLLAAAMTGYSWMDKL